MLRIAGGFSQPRCEPERTKVMNTTNQEANVGWIKSAFESMSTIVVEHSAQAKRIAELTERMEELNTQHVEAVARLQASIDALQQSITTLTRERDEARFARDKAAKEADEALALADNEAKMRADTERNLEELRTHTQEVSEARWHAEEKVRELQAQVARQEETLRQGIEANKDLQSRIVALTDTLHQFKEEAAKASLEADEKLLDMTDSRDAALAEARRHKEILGHAKFILQSYAPVKASDLNQNGNTDRCAA